MMPITSRIDTDAETLHRQIDGIVGNRFSSFRLCLSGGNSR